MNMNFIITLVAAFLCFIIPAISFNLIAKKNTVFNESSSIKKSTFVPIFTALILVSIVGYVFLYTPNDFIHSTNAAAIGLPLIGALLIYLSGYKASIAKYTSVIMLVCSIVTVIVMPDEAMSFFGNLNPWLNRIILILAWFGFSYIYRYSNTGDGMLATQSLTISGGIGSLAIIGALPFLIGFLAWSTFASFLALLSFSWYPSRVRISTNAASAFGFMLFGLIAFSILENCTPCIVIFCMFLFVDVIWAFLLKISFIEKYRNMLDNTSYQSALMEGMNPRQAAAFSFRLQLLLIFFGCFQAYSPKPESLVILTFILTLWFCYKYRTVPAPKQSLKDINTQVIEELQERMNDFKEYIGNNREEN